MEFVIVIVIIGVIIAVIAAANRPAPPSKAAVAATIIGGLIVGALVVAMITWNEIERWFNQNRQPNTIGELVRTMVANGEYTVVGNVLRNGSAIQSKTWQSKQIDAETQRRFRDTDRVIVYSS